MIPAIREGGGDFLIFEFVRRARIWFIRISSIPARCSISVIRRFCTTFPRVRVNISTSRPIIVPRVIWIRSKMWSNISPILPNISTNVCACKHRTSEERYTNYQ